MVKFFPNIHRFGHKNLKSYRRWLAAAFTAAIKVPTNTVTSQDGVYSRNTERYFSTAFLHYTAIFF